jgi:cytochrome c peroxidase
MKNLKLLVVFVFVILAVSFKFFSATVNSQTGLSAPTGVIASDSKYANKIRVEWDAIRNATAYRIFRNTTNNSATATDIGTTPANTFLDLTATAGQTFFYWIRAENGTVQSNLSASDQGFRVSSLQQGPIPPLEAPSVPVGNPITAAKVYLGKALFWDEQMSSTKTVSCGTCHTAGGGGDDLRSLNTSASSTNPGLDQIFGNADDIVASRGIPMTNIDGTYIFSSSYALKEQVTGRSSMSSLNTGYAPVLFWDGRALGTFRDPITNAVVLNNGGALESQAIGPPTTSNEMGHSGRNWTDVANRISASKPLAIAVNVPAPLKTWINGRTYPQIFEEVFGTPEVTPTRIALSIATYERTLYTDQTPLDMANAGITPLTAQEQNGRNLFVQVECAVCHAGALTSDNSFRYIGVRPQNDDTGRFQVTGSNVDLGRFRVPNLRNVELRGTYMHNGRFNTLDQVVAFYNRGGDFNAPNKDANVRPRGLSPQSQADIVAFLKRPLTDPRAANELPPFDRPTLYTETNRVPLVTGTGVAGTNGIIPQPMAIEPPLVGNPSFTVAVTNGMGGANATLVINSTDPGTSSIPAAGTFTRQTLALQGSGAGNGYGSINLAIPNNNALIGQTFFGRWYVADAGSASGFSISRLFTFTVFGDAVAVNRPTQFDFDGDAKTDISIYRPSLGQWWYLRSSDGANRAFSFGSSTDKIVPADYTGDGKTDIATFNPTTGFWNILRSEDGTFYGFPFGTAGDTAAPADYDGDGKADAAVFRTSTSTWFISKSTGGTTIQQFGILGDKSVVADYDGDGKADIAIYRVSLGQWWYLRSSDGGNRAFQFGTPTDKPSQGDYTGDGKADLAFFRPTTGEWFILRSEDATFYGFPYGTSGDIPAAGDYDGDGRFDAAVFRPSSLTWYVNGSTSGTQIVGFGATGDLAVPNAFVP